MSIESDGKILGQETFPSMQGLLAFARLVVDRNRAVSRDELAAMFWTRKVPRSWDAALTSFISKLRVLLGRAGLNISEVLSSTLGCYRSISNGVYVDEAGVAGHLAVASDNFSVNCNATPVI